MNPVVESLIAEPTYKAILSDYVLFGYLFSLMAIGASLYILLPIRLRYIFFIFLDTYGQADFSYSKIFQKNNELIKIQSTAFQLKGLVFMGLSEVVKGLTSYILSRFQGLASSLGVAGAIFGSGVRMVGEETAKQLTSMAKIVAYYMMYRYSRQAAGEQLQHVNESMYNLLQK